MKEKISELQKELDQILSDPNEDGTFGTDGSHEAMLGVFEHAYDKAEAVALKAIALLIESTNS